MHRTTRPLTKWYAEKEPAQRSSPVARTVNTPSKDHSLILNLDDVNHGLQHDLDDQGIAKTAREEKLRKRNTEMAKKAAEDARMAKLYREVVLKEKPVEGGFVPLETLGGIKPAAKKEETKEVGSFGD